MMKESKIALTKEELEQLKGSGIETAQVSVMGDVLNENTHTECTCYYTNFELVKNSNSITGCRCVCSLKPW